MCKRFPKVLQYGVGAGLVLLNLPIGIPWYYGNLSIYVDSYFISKVGSSEHSAGSLWLTGVFLSCLNAGIFFSGVFARAVGHRLTVFIGVIGFNISVGLTYFTCLHSFWLLHITLGVGGGFFTGLIFAMSTLYAAVWFPNAVGLATSVAASSLGGGSLVMNVLTTMFINPSNKTPDITLGTGKYFSSVDVVTKVPGVFLLLTAVSLVCHIIAFVLVRDHTDLALLRNEQRHKKCHKSQNEEPLENVFKVNISKEIGCGENGSGSLSSPKYGATTDKGESANLSMEQGTHRPLALDYTPLEVLKTRSFYQLCLAAMVMNYGLQVEVNYYKQFGLLYINDDYFLTTVGSCINITVLISRIVWGLAVDLSDLKTSLASLTALHVFASLFWYFTPMVNRWLFLAWTLLVQGIQSGVLVVFPVVTLRLFGRAHYVSNYGLVFGSGVLLNLIAPLFVTVIIRDLGYFWLFFSISCTSTVGLVLILLLPMARG
ncbi:uncharacterized protein LOC101845396 [Aplysia californica]|uniref:Uncharacterized protein LOC101845396 n=1 Tax=Aplysia californica TaxID=6500 RepID=A0ABM0JLV7_APLCA|nr:uncharacterized protein LOC101845396 [Aplysia californica]